jgi:DNA repair protein RecO
MLKKDEGIVLRTARSGETSQLLTFLGRESGKVRFTAKGALGSKSPWRGLFEPGRHVEVVYYYKEGRTLYFVKEASLGSPPPRRRDSLAHFATLLAAMELLDQVCYVGSPDAHIVDIVVEYVRSQDCPDPLFMFLALEIKLLSALGAAPGVDSCGRCGGELGGGTYSPSQGESFCREHSDAADALPMSPETAGVIKLCTVAPFVELVGVDVPAQRRKQLGKLVHWTYTHHVHGYSLPKSLNLI